MLAVLKAAGIPTDSTGGPNGGSGSNMTDLCNSYYAGHPDTKAFFADSGNGWGIGTFIQNQGLTGKFIGGGWDLGSQTLAFINLGVMQYTVDQKPYEQGFFPVYEAWQYLKSDGAYIPCGVNTGGTLVTKNNIASILANRPNG
jgi:simple sugar transport system substrate-binding protein